MNEFYSISSYTNLLNTGYNSTGHTEPHYRLWSYLIESSDERYSDYANLSAHKISVLTNGDADNPEYQKISLTVNNNGTQIMSNPSFAYYVNDEKIIEDSNRDLRGFSNGKKINI